MTGKSQCFSHWTSASEGNRVTRLQFFVILSGETSQEFAIMKHFAHAEESNRGTILADWIALYAVEFYAALAHFANDLTAKTGKFGEVGDVESVVWTWENEA